jgi:hypothetical protein
MERIEEEIFPVLAKLDVDRSPYEEYSNEVLRIEREIEHWTKEWDAIPAGTVIGKRRGANFVGYTGRAKEIQDNLTRLKSERDSTQLPRLRRQIVREQAPKVHGTSVPDVLPLDAGVETAADVRHAKALWQRREALARELIERYSTLDPNTMTPAQIALFMAAMISLVYVMFLAETALP